MDDVAQAFMDQDMVLIRYESGMNLTIRGTILFFLLRLLADS